MEGKEEGVTLAPAQIDKGAEEGGEVDNVPAAEDQLNPEEQPQDPEQDAVPIEEKKELPPGIG